MCAVLCGVGVSWCRAGAAGWRAWRGPPAPRQSPSRCDAAALPRHARASSRSHVWCPASHSLPALIFLTLSESTNPNSIHSMLLLFPPFLGRGRPGAGRTASSTRTPRPSGGAAFFVDLHVCRQLAIPKGLLVVRWHNEAQIRQRLSVRRQIRSCCCDKAAPLVVLWRKRDPHIKRHGDTRA